MWKKIGTLIAAATCLGGCAGRPAQPVATGDAPVSGAPQAKSLEITYTLGHSHRRVYMESRATETTAETDVDHSLLKKGSIAPARFQDYYTQVTNFVTKRRTPASVNTANAGTHTGEQTTTDCRAPFTIVLRPVAAETQTLAGCRQGDEESAFNRLVRDGEFLLYSSH